MRTKRAGKRDEQQQSPVQRVGEPFRLRDVLQRQKRQQRRPRRAARMRTEEQELGGDVVAQRDTGLARLRLGFIFLLRADHDVGQLRASLRRVAQKRRKLLGEIRHRFVALLAFGIQRVEDGVVRGRIKVVPAQRRQHQLAVFDSFLRLEQVRRQEGVLARQHLVRHRRQRPFVAASVKVLLTHLLKRHIADGAAAGHAEPLRVSQGRQAEIGHLDLARCVDEDVVGLDIQMQHAVLVRHLKRVRHRVEHSGDHVKRQAIVMVAQQLGERHALNVLHDQVRRGILNLEVVYRDDARVRQHGRRAGLVQAGDARERAHQRTARRVVRIRQADRLARQKLARERIRARSVRGTGTREAGLGIADGGVRRCCQRIGAVGDPSIPRARKTRFFRQILPRGNIRRVNGERRRCRGTRRTHARCAAETLRPGRVFPAFIRGNIKHIGPGEGSAQQLGLGQGDALDGHLALDACIPCHLHRAEAAGPRLGKGLVSIEYQLRFSHAHIILQRFARHRYIKTIRYNRPRQRQKGRR